MLFGLFEALFGIFTLFDFANRQLFAALKQCKSAQKLLSTKLELKSKTDSKKTEQERSLETKLRHHTHTLCPAPFTILVLAFAEVVLATNLYARCHIPEEVECAV